MNWSLKVGLALMVTITASIPSSADYSAPYNNDSWSIVDKAECAVIANNGAFRLDPSGTATEGDTPLIRAEWNGACKDGLVHGNGTLRLFFVGENIADHFVQYTGRADLGIFIGPISITGSSEWNGVWGALWDVETDDWKAGCDEEEDFRNQCKASDGIAMREAFLSARGGSTGGTNASVQSGATGANGDVFGKCVKISSYPEDGGIQTVWAMNNLCAQTIIVSYCFRADVEAAGDPNLCSRLEKRTHEIRGGGKIDFPFTLVEAGQAMSDGTIAGTNGLSVKGYACTGSSFPNVYFDEGKFLFRGC